MDIIINPYEYFTIRPLKKIFYIPSEDPEQPPKKKEFLLSYWFFNENTIVCKPDCDPSKSRLFTKKGQSYINIFPGYPHEIRNLSEFSAEDHAYAKLIFEHIRDIWCSGNWELTEYILKWFGGVSAGRKMYSILYLRSGQGWGKGIITDFIQRYVLGKQLVFKTSDPQTILGSFNAQLQGKLLLLLEEMPTERSDWNSLYRALKDKVTSDIIEIHEKYKTPVQYKNVLSTVVLTNENALRVENDDRRTVFLDVSPTRKGDLDYFKKLGNAMKHPGVRLLFYSYLRAIAKAYPDFDGNPPPMTDAKREHIISTLPPLFQFMKDKCISGIVLRPNLPVNEFYNEYRFYCVEKNIKPLSKITVGRTLSNELGISSILPYVEGQRVRAYNITREELLEKFLNKGWIHELDEIDEVDIPQKPKSDPNALNQFLAKINPTISAKPEESKNSPKKDEPETCKKPESPAECSKSSAPEVVKKQRLIPQPKNIYEYNSWLASFLSGNPEYMDDPEFMDPLNLYNIYVEETGDPPNESKNEPENEPKSEDPELDPIIDEEDKASPDELDVINAIIGN